MKNSKNTLIARTNLEKALSLLHTAAEILLEYELFCRESGAKAGWIRADKEIRHILWAERELEIALEYEKGERNV